MAKRTAAKAKGFAEILNQDLKTGEFRPVYVIDGEDQLRIPRATPSGKVFTLNGKGISSVNGRGKGDQHVQVVVDVPKSLSTEEEELIRKLAEHQDGKVGEDKGFLRNFFDSLHL